MEMKRLVILLVALVCILPVSCSGTADIAKSGDYRIEIEPGEEWLHDFIKNKLNQNGQFVSADIGSLRLGNFLGSVTATFINTLANAFVHIPKNRISQCIKLSCIFELQKLTLVQLISDAFHLGLRPFQC